MIHTIECYQINKQMTDREQFSPSWSPSFHISNFDTMSSRIQSESWCLLFWEHGLPVYSTTYQGIPGALRLH